MKQTIFWIGISLWIFAGVLDAGIKGRQAYLETESSQYTVESSVNDLTIDHEVPTDISVTCDERLLVLIPAKELFESDTERLQRIGTLLTFLTSLYPWSCEEIQYFATQLVPEYYKIYE
jgi:hypothetical protein